jgi:cobalt/nickel transport system ATP-binding protein
MNAVELEDAGFVYEDGTTALKDLSFSLPLHGKLAVIGPNGAGKSTLLHLIAGFRMPFSGRIRIMGKELTEKNADEMRRHLGIVFQDPDDQLFMPTVEEDVAFGPRNLRLSRIDERVMESLETLGIAHLAESAPQRLSHGMKKRVALAGVLAMSPEVLLLDEPTSGLDPESRRSLLKFLGKTDRSMIVATHDLEAAAEIADTGILLDGSPLAIGPLRDLLCNEKLMADGRLEAPAMIRLYQVMRARGFDVRGQPSTVEQAASEIIGRANNDGTSSR